MQKRMIYIFLGLIVVVIVAIVVADILGSRPEKRGENPFALNVDAYKGVDPELITYKETRNLKLQSNKYRGIAIADDEIFIIADNYLQVVDPMGKELKRVELDDSPRAITVSDDRIFIGFLRFVSSYTREGELISNFATIGDSAVLTSMAVHGEKLYVADAGNRQVISYTKDGEWISSFEGKREEDALHGFIIPSPYFDLVINDEELWVVNPGMHALENYSESGALRGYWDKVSISVEGFCGCCNPAHIAVLPNGNFVTSEKGIVRIKVYEQSGNMTGVVAAPEKFTDDGLAPDIAVNSEGEVFALDFDRHMIRIFEEK
jgi:hypothetical protein